MASGAPFPSATRPGRTVHGYHVTWSRDGTWEAICDHLRALVRRREGRDGEPSAAIIDARSVQGASTVCGETRGYDAGKKVSGRKTFALVDTLGLLLAVVVVAANVYESCGDDRVAFNWVSTGAENLANKGALAASRPGFPCSG